MYVYYVLLQVGYFDETGMATGELIDWGPIKSIRIRMLHDKPTDTIISEVSGRGSLQIPIRFIN